MGVGVVAPVVVAALVNWNAIVKVIDAVPRSEIDALRDTSDIHRHRCSFYGVDHGHGIVPVQERGHAHGRDHRHAMATHAQRPRP